MKFNVQIQTVPFALIGTEYEGTIEGAVELHNTLLGAYNASQRVSEGMTDKEVDTWLDNMFLEKGNSADIWAKRNPVQEEWLKRIKRSLSRIEAKHK